MATPRRVFPRIKEKVKTSEKKAVAKKSGTAPESNGSVKITIIAIKIQSMIVILNVGRKFFRRRISSNRLFVAGFIVPLYTATMDAVLLIAILVVGFLLLAYLINKKNNSHDLLEVIKMLQNTSTTNSEALNQRLDMVQKNLGEIGEIGRSMRDLQSFLNSPKLRGNVGEQVLKELLTQMLPKASFNLQYTFRSGEKVDAAIQTSGGIIPIDSKFPMENFQKMMKDSTSAEGLRAASDFQRDIKKHIDDISRKYILVDEGTIDYALMYLPSEAVYYEVVNNSDLFEYASRKRILPVSPTTFYAYMKAILMSFEGQKVEAKAKEILVALRAIQKDYGKVEESMNVLQKHLTNAANTLTTVASNFSQLGQKISNTRELGDEVKEEVKKIELQ